MKSLSGSMVMVMSWELIMDGIRITIVGLNGSSRRHLHSTRASRAEGSLGRLVCRIKLNG